MAQKTRLGLYGGPRAIYAGFVAKAENVDVAIVTYRHSMSPKMRRVSVSDAGERLSFSPRDRNRS